MRKVARAKTTRPGLLAGSRPDRCLGRSLRRRFQVRGQVGNTPYGSVPTVTQLENTSYVRSSDGSRQTCTTPETGNTLTTTYR
jgi:hypothetical protein